MIAVELHSNDQPLDEADAETPDAAVLTARTLWDEGYSRIQGQRRALVFKVDGAVVRRMEARP